MKGDQDQIQDRLKALQQKYAATGQDMVSYLDGLLVSDYPKYWEYLNIDTLLTLQKPKTQFPDEMIFIVYHQIVELYFKLILWELEQIPELDEGDLDTFVNKVNRLANYVEQIVSSFPVVSDHLDRKQFMSFRMALLPSSGFQSAQFRLIEFRSTELVHLVSPEFRSKLTGKEKPGSLYRKIYWKQGATEIGSGKKTITLSHFEREYTSLFLKHAREWRRKNLYSFYRVHFEGQSKAKEALRRYDYAFNVKWALAHFRAAAQHLHAKGEKTEATGGTNWQKYLPPRFQKISFFPSLWSEREMNEWGKVWVEEEIIGKKS